MILCHDHHSRPMKVLDRLHEEYGLPPCAPGAAGVQVFSKPDACTPAAIGDLLYTICRAARPQRVFSLTRSMGMLAVYVAMALKDNGGGLLVVSSSAESRADLVRRSIVDAELEAYVRVYVEGDEAIRSDLAAPLDMVFVEGNRAATAVVPSLAHGLTLDGVLAHAPRLRDAARALDLTLADDDLNVRALELLSQPSLRRRHALQLRLGQNSSLLAA
ncbi:MAG: class I SAM-dependent methyltransferase [Rhodocyclaceae bacterium]